LKSQIVASQKTSQDKSDASILNFKPCNILEESGQSGSFNEFFFGF